MPSAYMPYVILRDGPCAGMKVAKPTMAYRGTGVAVKLLDGSGYALYDLGLKAGYYYSETLTQAEVKRASLSEPKQRRAYTGASK